MVVMLKTVSDDLLQKIEESIKHLDQINPYELTPEQLQKKINEAKENLGQMRDEIESLVPPKNVPDYGG